LKLVWSADNTDLPASVLVVPDATPERPYLTHNDNPDDLPLDASATIIEWSEWQLSPPITHIEQKCGRKDCGYVGLQWTSRGLAVPQPGETFTVDQPRHTKSGREYLVQKEVPAWRVWRLHAFLCGQCRHLDVYWTGPDGMSWHDVATEPPGVLW